jgi:hypothetical protein
MRNKPDNIPIVIKSRRTDTTELQRAFVLEGQSVSQSVSQSVGVSVYE